MATSLDPKGINQRLYNQLARLLDEMEKWDETITIPQRINALIAIGRIQVMFKGLRKEENDPDRQGSSVRKYAKAFSAHATRGRTANPRPAEPDPDEVDTGFDPEGDAA